MRQSRSGARSMRRKGQGLVEFALILPLLLLVFIGLFEFARILFIYVNISNAAREGARYGVVHPTDLGGIRNHVIEQLSLVPPMAPNVFYDHGPGSDRFTDESGVAKGDRVGVQLYYNVQPITPLMAPFMSDGLDLATESWRTIQHVRVGETSTPAAPAPPSSLFTDTPTPDPAWTDTPVPTLTPTLTPTPYPTPTETPQPPEPIVINPVDLDDTSVIGTAEPGRAVTLLVAQTGLQRTVTVQADGTFRFLDLHEMICGYTIVVSGYGQQAYATVCAGATPTPTLTPTPSPTPTALPDTAYIHVEGGCHEAGPQTLTVHGAQIPLDNSFKDIVFLLDGAQVGGEHDYSFGDQGFTEVIDVDLDAGEPYDHALTANILNNQNDVLLSLDTTFWVCVPVLLPDLTITSLELLDEEPYSTYQPLNALITIENQGERDVTSLFWVQFYGDYGEFTDPSEWNFIRQYGFTSLAAQASVSFTMVMEDGYDTLGGHQMAAEIDRWQQVEETDETNNLLAADLIVVSTPGPTPEPTVAVTPEAMGGIYGLVVGYPQASVAVNCYPPIPETTADGSGGYRFDGVPVGTWVVTGEIFLNGDYLYGSRTVVVSEGLYSQVNLYLESFGEE